MNKVTGDDGEDKEQKLKDKSDYARAFQMFQDGRPFTDVAIELDMETPTVICYYEDSLGLVNMQKLVTICNDMKDDLPLFLRQYDRIKKERLGKPQIIELLQTPNRLLGLKKVEMYNNHIWQLNSKKLQLEKEIEEKRRGH
ncbi:MAG: hypothetical protein WKF36_11175 [Candidatus Nitrosocosmicus sp.]